MSKEAIENLSHAIAVGKISADNDNYRCGVSIKTAELILAEIFRLKDRVKELEDIVSDELTNAKAQWANVGNHPASRWAKEVRFYEKVLKGKQ